MRKPTQAAPINDATKKKANHNQMAGNVNRFNSLAPLPVLYGPPLSIHTAYWEMADNVNSL